MCENEIFVWLTSLSCQAGELFYDFISYMIIHVLSISFFNARKIKLCIDEPFRADKRIDIKQSVFDFACMWIQRISKTKLLLSLRLLDE